MNRGLWGLWAKGCAVGNAQRFPRQAARFAEGELSTNPQTQGFLFFGFVVPGSVVRFPLGTVIPWESVERRTLFSTTTRTVAWAVSPHFCKDGYEREYCC